MTDWSERIPAAIAKAEGWFKQPGIIGVAVFVSAKGDVVYVTAGEVALAYALYNATKPHADGCRCNSKCVPLLAFTLKMEGLSND